MTIEELRGEIDKIDNELSSLYVDRMKACKGIGELKKNSGSAVNVSARENEILMRVTENAPDELKVYVKQLYDQIFMLSKSYQSSLREPSSKTVDKLKELIKADRSNFPIRATVACQGVEGAYSQVAAEKLFEICTPTYFKTFDGVFNAVDKGLCEYGVLPIENSNAGSVLAVYDLMKKYNFYIVKSLRLKVDHCLATRGNEKIRKVYSHGQALMQCNEYIKKMGLEAVEVENTAVAARLVAESNESGIAAICNERCAELYGLTVRDKNVQDESSNYTRFICISKDLKLFKGADKISVMTGLEHKIGSLNRLLSRFYTQGLNLTKLESRPVGGGDFEFVFYFDFEGDIESKGVLNLLSDLENSSDKFAFLGCYKETL